MFTYKVEVVKVVDGDTIDVDIDLGFGIWHRNVRLRLDGVDAFETRLGRGTTEEMKAKGIQARELVEELMTNFANEIEITTTKRGKYGRWIARVSFQGNDLGDYLVHEGLAVYKAY